jgi:hypothetical protein
MGEQPQPEREIELCTPDVVDLPIINLQDAGRPFKIKVLTIHMMIVGALERFNEYIRAEFLEWHIGLLKRMMEKMEIEKEAQHLKAAEARSRVRLIPIVLPSLVVRKERVTLTHPPGCSLCPL